MTTFVRVRDCTCPESPHAEEGDGVFLRDTLSATGGILAEGRITDLVAAGRSDEASLTSELLPLLVRTETTGANYSPFDIDALLEDWREARSVIIRAGDLYLDAVVAPLVKTPPKPSRTGRTRAMTSPTTEPTPEPSE